MAHTKSHSPAARAYAQALIELATETGQSEQVAQELSVLARLVYGDASLRAFFADPAIRPEERWGVIKRAFKGNASPLFFNFLGILSEKDRLGLIPEINTAYGDLLDAQQNRAQVQLTVASKLDDAQLAQVQQRVSAALGKTAVIDQKIDDSIIGGLVLRVEDKVIDGSVKAQLDAMRRQLLSAKV